MLGEGDGVAIVTKYASHYRDDVFGVFMVACK